MKEDSQVEIESEIYEKLALIGMEWGIDDPTEFCWPTVMVFCNQQRV